MGGDADAWRGLLRWIERARPDSQQASNGALQTGKIWVAGPVENPRTGPTTGHCEGARHLRQMLILSRPVLFAYLPEPRRRKRLSKRAMGLF